MGRSISCRALVLKRYDIGEADRLCVFLTDALGRIAVVAKGVRKLGSRNGGAIQSFQYLEADLSEHSSGLYLRSARCLSPFSRIRKDLRRFLLASKGSELLLHFLHDTEPSERIFALALEYFMLCDEGIETSDGASLLFSMFQLMLMKELGVLPSVPPYLSLRLGLRGCVTTPISIADGRSLDRFCTSLLKEHLSFPMKSSMITLQPH